MINEVISTILICYVHFFMYSGKGQLPENESRRADIQTKVEELNQSLRQRDKVKDDAIAQLSDQLVSLSARLQEIERRQV
ncbi:MAG: hypothetical protein WCA39_01045 [Nitrososphaeraceae archaeon]